MLETVKIQREWLGKLQKDHKGEKIFQAVWKLLGIFRKIFVSFVSCNNPLNLQMIFCGFLLIGKEYY